MNFPRIICAMTIQTTPLEGLVVLQPQVFRDDRGFFLETYNKATFQEIGIHDEFVQDNHSFSKQNTVRGLHFQTGDSAQGKLVRVIEGEVFDVAVDIRPDSPTFGQWFGLTLSGTEHNMMYVPAGFAHGFCVLSPTVHFLYKCTAVYNKEAEGGIVWNDPQLAIQWPIDPALAIVSEKDQHLPTFQALELRH